MYTSVLATVLASLMAGRAPTVEVAWSADYDAARQAVQTEKKPLAVFLGSGENGYDKVCRDGTLSKEAQEALQNSYVCLYVDMDTEAGKRLAEAFEITKPAGLVISNRAGTKQAFYHDGALAAADLDRTLTRFANPTQVVRAAPAQRKASNGRASGRANRGSGRRSNYPMAQPAYGYPIGFGGGCPGGSCGGGGCAGGNCGRR
jgi:hypothetical protein